jgi:hypothetical protein
VLVPTPAPAAEARRSHVADLAGDAALAGAADASGKHFTGASPAAGFDVQIAELSVAHRRATLVMEAGKAVADARPLLVVTEADGRLAWSKTRPAAGILAPVTALAVAGGPRGRVALAACDPPTKSVALRLWDDDGSPFADFQVLDVEGCDGLTLLYWPRHGWIVVALAPDVTRARLVSESGSLQWPGGLDLGVRSKAGELALASVAADTDDSFVLVQAVQPDRSAGSAFHALAFRYDAHGTAIWPAAIDLGALARAPAAGDRVVVTPAGPAGVRVAVPGDFEVEVKPSGDLSPRRRARP